MEENEKSVPNPEAQVESPAAPAVEAPATGGDAQPSFFEVAKKAYGRDFKDPDDYLTYTKQVQGELQELREKTKRGQDETTGAIQGLRDVEKWLNSNGKQYASDKERFADAVQWMSEQSVDFTELASKDPEAVMLKHFAQANPELSSEDIKSLVEDEIIKIEALADRKEFDSDEDRDAFISKRLSLVARQFVPSLEAGKAKLDFNPKGVKSPEEVAAESAEWSKENEARIGSILTEFKGIDLGEAGIWEMPLIKDGKINDQYQPVIDALANPQAFVDRFVDNGHWNYALLAKLAAFESEGVNAISKRIADAKGEGAHNVITKAMNPGVGQPNPPQPGDNNADPIWKRPVVRV